MTATGASGSDPSPPRVQAGAGDDGPTFFFQHIMKTAGTSFAHQIVANFGGDELFPDPAAPAGKRRDQYWQIAEVRALDPDRIGRVRMFHGHFPFLVASMVGADTTLTLLRDPIERTISHMRHCERHFPAHRGRSWEAIYDDAWLHPLFFRNYQVKQFALTADDRPEAHNEDIVLDAGRLDIAISNLEQVTVLGLTDRYGDFLDEVRRRFGWTISTRGRQQVSPGSVDVPGALRARIEADNQMDIEFYEHVKALYERRRTGASAP